MICTKQFLAFYQFTTHKNFFRSSKPTTDFFSQPQPNQTDHNTLRLSMYTMRISGGTTITQLGVKTIEIGLKTSLMFSFSHL
jgi:hypothetical protein